jgi:hypothetical protein
MKSTLVRPEEVKASKIKYPILMDDGRNLVVLFTKDSTGTVLSSRNGFWQLGTPYANWNIDVFRPYRGTVVLSNNDDD